MSGQGFPAAAALIAAVLAVVGPGVPARAGDTASPLESLVASERAFSAMSVEHGMKDAFLEYLAADGIIFRPLPVNGREVWTARKPSPATLIWEPSRAEVSAAGDLGWTTGPWDYRPPADSTGAPPREDQIAHGHFTSVWARQSDGRWRVVLDAGISHERPERGVGSGDFVARPEHTWAARGPRPPAARAKLDAFDRRFANDARKNESGALGIWATDDVRLHREGAFPVEGRDAAKAAVRAVAPLVRILPQGTRVAASDDLGYTFGVLERAAGPGAAPDSSTYVHLWRRESDRKWRIALIVENPLAHR